MINKLKQTIAFAIAAALVGLTGCASTSEPGSIGAFFDDASITTKVKSAIFNEPSLKVMNISVRTEDKVVELSGTVKSRAEKAKVAEIARKVEGVQRVRNDLTVQP